MPQAAERLKAGGLVLLEIGWRQGQAVSTMARQTWPKASVTLHQDFAGHDRIVMIQT